MRRRHVIRARVAWGLALMALAALLGGCMSAGLGEQSDQEKLPWSEPAAWERTTIGVPF